MALASLRKRVCHHSAICHDSAIGVPSQRVTFIHAFLRSPRQVVITAPYLAGLARKAAGAARPRISSFTTGKTPKMPSVAAPNVKAPSVKNLGMNIPGFKKKAPAPAAGAAA